MRGGVARDNHSFLPSTAELRRVIDEQRDYRERMAQHHAKPAISQREQLRLISDRSGG